MSTIFDKIISGEIPCHKVAENNDFLAFLDVFPVQKGHVLVIPKQPVDYIFNLKNDDFVALHLFSKKVAEGLKIAVPCKKIGVAVIGLEVPHAHIHLVPMNAISDMDFSKKIQMSQEELAQLTLIIKPEIDKIVSNSGL
jgi:histidine triad (HIT) family protein